MNWAFHYRGVARVLFWIGIVAIIVLSVVPAKERPVTDAADWFGAWNGHLLEHVAAFAPVAAAFAIGAVAELVGIEGGVVSGVFNLESSGVEASDWRPRHDEQYHEA